MVPGQGSFGLLLNNQSPLYDSLGQLKLILISHRGSLAFQSIIAAILSSLDNVLPVGIVTTYIENQVIFCILVGLFRPSAKTKVFDLRKWYVLWYIWRHIVTHRKNLEGNSTPMKDVVMIHRPLSFIGSDCMSFFSSVVASFLPFMK
jgi:hypothetical protein